jgi:hypothetical protein
MSGVWLHGNDLCAHSFVAGVRRSARENARRNAREASAALYGR